jgi:hypothetical protein
VRECKVADSRKESEGHLFPIDRRSPAAEGQRSKQELRISPNKALAEIAPPTASERQKRKEDMEMKKNGFVAK